VSSPVALVRAALDAVTVVSPAGYGWFGARSDVLPPHAESAMTPADARAYLLYALQNRLYADFYCVGGARPAGLNGAGARYAPPALTPFVQALSAANTGSGAREGGWHVVAAAPGHLVVQRADGLRFRAQPSEVVAPGGVPAAGDALAVVMPKELLRLSPGFYMALGDAELTAEGFSALLRLYWNVRAEGAAPLMHALTRGLNDAGLPFRFKVVGDPARYGRCDAAVLYVGRDAFAAIRGLVEETHARLLDVLDPAVPALTKQLGPGLGLAEDPAGGRASFGQSRCLLLAEAAVRAAERGVADSDARVAIARECFAEAGVDLDTPYLEPGGVDAYELAP
jgi:hypothetical protein